MSRDAAPQKAKSCMIKSCMIESRTIKSGTIKSNLSSNGPARRHGAKQAWQAASIPDNWRFHFRMRRA